MDNRSFEHNDNIPADLDANKNDKSWHIPRPTLARSSKGSEGSTSSNNSTQSARSGSLLLTAANLAQIQLEEQQRQRLPPTATTRQQNLQYYLQQSSKNDLLSLPIHLEHPKDQRGDDARDNYFDDILFHHNNNNKKDPDSVSVASSMHFTVVNMNTSRPAVKGRSFCRKHQLTILILTMSALFTIGILTAIFLLEMRARRQQ